MTTIIMEQWLLAFYQHIGSQRRVLLLMDNFSPHITALQLASPPPNIMIQFSPANSTSFYQPLDQGIIQNLKHYYKKSWIQYMINCLDQGQDPDKTRNLFYTVQWITKSWRYEVQNSTIYNYFRKSTVITPQIQSLPTPEPPSLSPLYQKLTDKFHGDIQFTMALENFLNPADENLYQEPTEIPSILSDIMPVSDDDDDDDDELPVIVPSSADALSAIQTATIFAYHQEEITAEEIKHLEHLERLFTRLRISQQRQVTLNELWSS
jgi:hypothetical protein